MSRTKRKTLAPGIVMMWLAAASYIFTAETTTFESGETQTALIATGGWLRR
jgi:hypothetical protein